MSPAASNEPNAVQPLPRWARQLKFTVPPTGLVITRLTRVVYILFLSFKPGVHHQRNLVGCALVYQLARLTADLFFTGSSVGAHRFMNDSDMSGLAVSLVLRDL